MNKQLEGFIMNNEYPALHLAVVVYNDFGEINERHMYAHDEAICKEWCKTEREKFIIYNPPYAIYLDGKMLYTKDLKGLDTKLLD